MQGAVKQCLDEPRSPKHEMVRVNRGKVRNTEWLLVVVYNAWEMVNEVNCVKYNIWGKVLS